MEKICCLQPIGTMYRQDAHFRHRQAITVLAMTGVVKEQHVAIGYTRGGAQFRKMRRFITRIYFDVMKQVPNVELLQQIMCPIDRGRARGQSELGVVKFAIPDHL